jgi:hypothetical protein
VVSWRILNLKALGLSLGPILAKNPCALAVGCSTAKTQGREEKPNFGCPTCFKAKVLILKRRLISSVLIFNNLYFSFCPRPKTNDS